MARVPFAKVAMLIQKVKISLLQKATVLAEEIQSELSLILLNSHISRILNYNKFVETCLQMKAAKHAATTFAR